MKPIKVLLADDHDMMLDGLTALLDTLEHIEVVGAVRNGVQALVFLENYEVDVVLADLNMPLLNGLGLNWEIRKRFPNVRVLMLTMIDDADQIRDAIQSGIDGYILKKANKIELERAIISVAAGNKYFEHAVIQQLAQIPVRNSVGNNLQPDDIVPLTAREREILLLVAQGLTNQEIAGKIVRSQLTVDTHRKNIFRKLGVNNVVELVHYAVRNGLIPNA
ncbi:response regulator transcription factor [Spirosoma harenae]